MTPELSELYQEVILDHNRRPRHYGELAAATHRSEGFNPLCGDRLTVSLRLAGDRIEEVNFQGSGCAISRASASVMTETLAGKSRAEAQRLFDRFHRLVTGEETGADVMTDGEMAALSGVSQFPVRVKCATLAWHTFRAALEGRPEPVSTE
jgi:nitrogen fixation NifU-like protein